MVKDINVAVIGGSGFLGQHVITELLAEKQKSAEDTKTESSDSWVIKNIKLLDVEPVSKESQTVRKDADTVTYESCDILNQGDLEAKLKGCSAVINCSSIDPDFLDENLGYSDRVHKVNVDGTINIVKVCQKLGIEVLLHTSTVSVKMGGKRIIEHTETLTPEVSENDLILGDYARGRLKAERAVLDANGTVSQNGVTLKTMALRPPMMYGEGDKTFVPVIYNLSKAYGNKIPSVGNPAAFMQAVYVGNVAVAHVCGLKHLMATNNKIKLESCAGLPVYITDDSPPNSFVGLTTPFLSQVGIEPSDKKSYWFTSLSLYLKNFVNAIGLGNSMELHTTWRLHYFAATISVVSRMRAEVCLGYVPPYLWEDAERKSKLYYCRILV